MRALPVLLALALAACNAPLGEEPANDEAGDDAPTDEAPDEAKGGRGGAHDAAGAGGNAADRQGGAGAGMTPDAAAAARDGGVPNERRDAAPSPTDGGRGLGRGAVLWFDKQVVFGVPKPWRPRLPVPVESWSKPFDYTKGRYHVRVEVLRKPDAAPVWLELMFWRGDKHHCLMCVDALTMTKPGVYTCSVGAADPFGGLKSPTGVAYGWRCAGPPTYDAPFDKLELSAKLASPTGDRHSSSHPTTELGGAHVPLEARVTSVLVPPGVDFAGWDFLAARQPEIVTKN